jgi:hypothetical protein
MGNVACLMNMSNAYKVSVRQQERMTLIQIFGCTLEDNPSSRTMALGSTQPLTEMSTRNISWG